MAKSINLRDLSDNQLLAEYKARIAKYKSEKRYVEDKEHKLSTRIPDIVSGDLSDVNKIIWPFYFSTPFVEVIPNTSVSRFISITQEASFVWTHIVRTVFEKVEVAPAVYEWNYVDPNDYIDGVVEDLEFTVTDAQSSRTFFHDPMSLNHVGHSQEPQKLNSPMMIPSNNNMEVKFFNNNASRTYVPFVTFYGYRVRVKDAQEILGLVNK